MSYLTKLNHSHCFNDIDWLTENISSKMNGLTMCSGSYGVRGDNDQKIW